MNELVAQIPGWPGYEISSSGVVTSVPRTIARKDGTTMRVDGRVMKPCVGPHGYTCVGLSRLGAKTRLFPVHLLMARAFLKPPSCVRPEVDHINRVKTDNRLENLRWVPRYMNAQNGAASKANTSGVRGVAWDKATNKWRATARELGRRLSLGRFDSLEDAKRARSNWERSFWVKHTQEATC